MAGPEERFPIDVAGRATVTGAYARPRKAIASLVVAPGAGGTMDHPFLTGFTRAINDEGIATLRFNFAYQEAGRRSPDAEPILRAAWEAALGTAASRGPAGEKVFAGGKSLGGRIASMVVADGLAAAGLVFLGYPLHPPGRPERIRDEHLYRIKVPMLFLQGTSDPFASSDLLRKVLKKLGARATYHAIEGGDHSFNVRGARRDPREVGASLAPLAAAFIREHT